MVKPVVSRVAANQVVVVVVAVSVRQVGVNLRRVYLQETAVAPNLVTGAAGHSFAMIAKYGGGILDTCQVCIIG